jgi:hypothetical protein
MLSAHVKKPQEMEEHVRGIVAVNSLFVPSKKTLHDWAGQVEAKKYKKQPVTNPCDYELHNMFAVLWDGMIAACCYDSEGLVGLSVDDVLERGFEFREVDLCRNCSLGRGDVAWLSDQLGRFPAKAV